MRRLLFISGLLLAAISSFAQETVIPRLEPGLKSEYAFGRKGKNLLSYEVLDVAYSDSSSQVCRSKWHIRVSLVKGADITVDLNSRAVLKEGDSHVFELYHWIKNESYNVTLSYKPVSVWSTESTDIIIGHIPAYDNSAYYAKKEREKKLSEEEAARLAAIRAREDSLRYAYRERQNKILTPEYLANWIGASFFTKESIEHDCEVMPAAYNGGYVMYDFYKCPVSMEFDDESHVCIEISFRLFGEDGYQMKSDLINYGYQLKSKSRGDLIIENNFQNVQTGTSSIYKYKLKNGGYSTCRITEGQAMMFTFTRTKN